MIRESGVPNRTLYIILALLILGLLGIMTAGLRTLGERKGKASGEELVRLEEASPQTVAQSFLSALRLHHWDAAYLLLAQDVRLSVPYEQFENSISRWMNQGRNAWGLKYRKVGDSSLAGNAVVINVESDAPDSARQTWKWRLLRGGKGWRISDLSGGPSIGRNQKR